ncbi:arginine--tRNA ligase [Clostridiales bacterium PH28_bin88]|nr:arginine--tRNA ligase [Clostridiales bacterium PH28_bin88]
MYMVEQVEKQIAAAAARAAEKARAAGEFFYQELPEFVVEVPREKAHGDFATNLGMALAREARKPPRQIAEALVRHVETEGTWISRVEVAGPGFINFTLDHRWLYQVLPQVVEKGEAYGRSDHGLGRRVQVEFVSANPTGLLHMGNARGAALGDSIAALLDAVGYRVSREFYINDAGNQILNFGKSLEARYLQLLGMDVPFPDEGYHGEDIIETMRGLVAEVGDRYVSLEPEVRRESLVKYALQEKLSAIKEVLEQFGVHYDVWFSEQTLHDSGAVQRVIEELRGKGYVYEKEGALWFKSTTFGDEKDEVVVRSNGVPTYFAADIAYHRNKFQRGFDWVIDIWGADHHGHVSRMKGAMAALGYDPERLDVVLMQLVRLFQGGEVLRMSKRTGQYITLSELVEEVGVDAARYFFVMRSADSHLEFDLDLAKTQSADNPVYYVQYAHARICSILRQAEEMGYIMPRVSEALLDLLGDPAELELIRKIADFPGVVAGAAEALEPHRLTRYAQELATLFHAFYTNCRVLVQEDDLRGARMVLADATRITLRNLLRIIGVTAPERM